MRMLRRKLGVSPAARQVDWRDCLQGGERPASLSKTLK